MLVVHRFPKTSETFIVAKFTGLLERGWDVHVVCSESPEEEWQRYPALAGNPDARRRVHVIAPTAPAWKALAWMPVVFLRTLILAPAATIRYCQVGWKRFGLRLFKYLYVDAPIVVLSPDLVQFEFGTLAPPQLHLRDLVGCRLTVSFRGFDLANYSGHPAFFSSLWGRVEGIHVLGQYLANLALTAGCPPEVNLTEIPPAIALEQFTPNRRDGGVVGTAERPLRVLSVGRLRKAKAYPLGLEAIAALRDLGVQVEHHHCGGATPGFLDEAAVVEQTQHRLRLDGTTTLMGDVPADVVKAELAWADVFLHPATAEPFGNALLEAQASALPVVCTEGGGALDNIEQGVTGIAVPAGDASALARAMAELAGDGDRRLAMGQAGRVRAEERFDLSSQLDQIEAFVQGALTRPRVG